MQKELLLHGTVEKKKKIVFSLSQQYNLLPKSKIFSLLQHCCHVTMILSQTQKVKLFQNLLLFIWNDHKYIKTAKYCIVLKRIYRV